jgi:hypothetical protein
MTYEIQRCAINTPTFTYHPGLLTQCKLQQN